uniref:Serpentine receptor class gamma n=1 Tax=Panagrellus redivivus TaxID=6233 RepID=A0A7E4W204_PANRE
MCWEITSISRETVIKPYRSVRERLFPSSIRTSASHPFLFILYPSHPLPEAIVIDFTSSFGDFCLILTNGLFPFRSINFLDTALVLMASTPCFLYVQEILAFPFSRVVTHLSF